MSRPSASAAALGLLIALLLPAIFAATCGSTQGGSQAVGPNGEYNCGYDWNGNGYTKDGAGTSSRVWSRPAWPRGAARTAAVPA